MKSTRKIIPALVMLLVSAIMLSTASFAWLASSTEVKAGPMTVKANTDVVYMEISNNKTQWGNTANATNATADNLKLVTAAVEPASKVVTWKTAAGAAPGASDADDKTYQTVNPITAEYALINTFYVRMSDKSTTDLENLKISAVTINGSTIDAETFDESLRVLVVAEQNSSVVGYQCWDLGTNSLSTEGNFKSTDTLASKVDKSTTTLNVYIYYDGEDTYAFTNNLYSALDREITVSFSATVPSGS